MSPRIRCLPLTSLPMPPKRASAIEVLMSSWPQIEGAIDPKVLKAFAKDVTLTRLEKLSLDERANELLQKGGLRFIGEDLTAAEDSLTGRYGFAEAGRIIEDLTGFRSKAMQAAGPAARWLEG